MKMTSALPCALVALTLAFTNTYAQELVATEAARSNDYTSPVDTTPSPDGATFYFLAIGPNGPSIFRAPSTGGPASLVVSGAPFVSPVGLAMSSDGTSLYVADRLAWAPDGSIGQIFVVQVSGRVPPRPLPGATGFSPRGIEVNNESGQDTLYFTGSNPDSRLPGVYRIAAGGATAPTVVFEGAPMIEPEGVAVSRAGDLYITDRGNTPFTGSVYKIASGNISRIVETIRAGSPAGIALSLNESRLLVSTLQPTRTRAQVLVVDLATLETSPMTAGIGQNIGAGGIHRAKLSEVYAWAGISKTPPHGPIYKIMNQ